MYKTLLQLEWKNLLRSANLGRNIAMRLLFLFLFLYFSSILIFFSSMAYFIIEGKYPETDPVTQFNTYLIYYYGIEFLIRFMLQKIPIVRLKPLLVQNIGKRQLIHFLLFKSTFSIFNFMPLFAFTPFAITLLAQGYEPRSTVFVWWAAVMLISMFLNYFTLFLQKKVANSNAGFAIILIVYAIIFGLQYFEIIDIPSLIGQGLELLTSSPIYIFLILMIIMVAYFADFYDYKKDLYIEEKNPAQNYQVNKMEYFWIDYFGEYGPYLHNDIRLILRNKRAKNLLFMSALMLLYGFFFIFNQQFQSIMGLKMGTYLFLGIFMTGMFAMNFGQFIPAWDSGAYGLFSTANIKTKEYLTSKVLLMAFSVIIFSPFIFLYAFIDTDVIWPFFAGIFVNLGIVIPGLLFISQYNYKKLDMTKSPMMNYQGLGWTQWIGVFAGLLFPLILYGIVAYLSSPKISLIFIQAVSIAGVILLPWIIKKIAKAYHHNKYKRIQGFKS